MAKLCEVCGKPSGFFPICASCNSLKEKGKVIKCEACGKWHKFDETCACSKKQPNIVESKKQETKPCVVCGKPAPNGALCIDCYKEKERAKADFVQNRTKQQISDHYYNQRNALFRVKNQEFIDNGSLRLIALAEELSNFHNDEILKERVFQDISRIKEYKSAPKSDDETKQGPSSKKSFDDEDYRKQWPAEHQCDDGHYVRSLSEKTIDDWLYNNKYVHAYEKSVFMDSEPEAVVLSDFYLPDGNVYIEFWGLNDDQKYLERKEKKIKMYQDNKYQLISLEEKDVKRLNDIMPRRLHEFIKK
jgi:hypothetical protein